MKGGLSKIQRNVTEYIMSKRDQGPKGLETIAVMSGMLLE